MAIAFDTAVTPAITSSVSSVSWSHTCTGSDRLLIVSLYHDTNGDVVTGATYNGVAMTLVAKVNNVSPSDVWEYMFYLTNPASGTNTVTVNMGAIQSGNIIYGSASYTGVNSSGQPDSSATNNGSAGTATSITLTTTSIADNCWAIGMMRDGSGGESVGAGTTNRALGVSMALMDGNAAIHPAGSVSLKQNFNSTNRYAGIIATFAPVQATVTSSSSTMALLGVA